MFEIVGTKSLDSNAIDFVSQGINFVGRTFENNGIQGLIEKRDFEPNEPFTITATVIGNYKYVKYQKEPYYCSQNIDKLTPKKFISRWNDDIAYFFVTLVQKFVSLYDGQQGGYKLDDIKNHLVVLPITQEEEIDFDFMESFIRELEEERVRELEEERVRELESYLAVAGLSDYTLTDEEQDALNAFDSLDWGKFRIGDLFDILSYKKRFDANKTTLVENCGHPYIVRTALNNGQKGFIDEDEVYLNDGNTISFGQDTATMFYQENPYFTGDKIKIMKSFSSDFNKKNAMYLISAMTKVFSNFSWGTSSFSIETIKSQIVSLPEKDGKPDYYAMETFISAVQKLVIKDVVLYADRKIAATKQVIDPH